MGSFDFSIVGGGIIGVAIAYQIQKKYPNKNLAIFEKEKEFSNAPNWKKLWCYSFGIVL